MAIHSIRVIVNSKEHLLAINRICCQSDVVNQDSLKSHVTNLFTRALINIGMHAKFLCMRLCCSVDAREHTRAKRRMTNNIYAKIFFKMYMRPNFI